MLATKRNVYWCVEQPKNSLLYKHVSMGKCLQTCNARKCATYLGGFGADAIKPLDLYHTMPEPVVKQFLHRTLRWRRARVIMNPKYGQLGVRKGRWINGKKKEPQQSQVYPQEFCKAIANAVFAVQE